jgi:cellulose synthase/poly-beta-1,6-N-acetylglucosamine synthase-like glycosyltransferase
MLDWLLLPLALAYFLVVGVLFIYGINFFYMSWKTLQMRQRAGRQPASRLPASWPSVTVQLPIYNELYVAERVIAATARLDYPADLLEIQVLDDSTDETRAIVRKAVDWHRARGVNITLLPRTDRNGYKAGALQAGLRQANGKFVAMFDADFVPPSDYLQRILPCFQPDTAFVQARWGHLNRDYSLLTQLQSLAIDAHFVVEQFARWTAGLWFNFNGTAGVWRRAALDDAGGWKADTLTEDLDLSYRALLRGWKGQYARDVVVPAELPVSIIAFRRQQHRWAKGSLECALKLGPQVWASSTSWRVKAAATLHLTGYAVHLFLFALALLYPVVLLLSQRFPELITLFGIAYLFNFTALAPTLFFVIGQQQLGHPWWRSLPRILFVTAVGSGLMINTLRAALQIPSRTQSVFERTAKYGINGGPGQEWMTKKYQLKLDPIVYWELGFGLLNLVTTWYAVQLHNWAVAFYAAIFCIGLSYVAGLTIAQALAVYRRRRTPRRSAIAAGLHVETEVGEACD